MNHACPTRSRFTKRLEWHVLSSSGARHAHAAERRFSPRSAQVTEAASRQLATLNTNCRYLHHDLPNYSEALAELFPEPLKVRASVLGQGRGAGGSCSIYSI